MLTTMVNGVSARLLLPLDLDDLHAQSLRVLRCVSRMENDPRRASGGALPVPDLYRDRSLPPLSFQVAPYPEGSRVAGEEGYETIVV